MTTTDPLETDVALPLDALSLVCVPGVSSEYAREWRGFARWCAAAEFTALPARAATVLAYLDDNPGTPATQRARVTAINAVHRHSRHPLPGDAEVVRRHLNPGRARRLTNARALTDRVLPHLPSTGWTEGLFGRRDAAVLLTATTGLSWPQIAALTQRDLTITDHVVTIGPQPLAELPATGDPITCPVEVFRRWTALLAVAPPATGHIRLERVLAGTEPADPTLRDEHRHLPVFTGFDARGFPTGLPDELDHLTPDTIAEITTRRLATTLPPDVSGDLDSSYYERGVQARLRTRAIGEDLDALFERLDQLAEAALEVSEVALRSGQLEQGSP